MLSKYRTMIERNQYGMLDELLLALVVDGKSRDGLDFCSSKVQLRLTTLGALAKFEGLTDLVHAGTGVVDNQLCVNSQQSVRPVGYVAGPVERKLGKEKYRDLYVRSMAQLERELSLTTSGVLTANKVCDPRVLSVNCKIVPRWFVS